MPQTMHMVLCPLRPAPDTHVAMRVPTCFAQHLAITTHDSHTSLAEAQEQVTTGLSTPIFSCMKLFLLSTMMTFTVESLPA